MRVLWTHNFDPNLQNSGRFMYMFADGIRELGVDLELFYLGNLRSVPNLFDARKRLKGIGRYFDVIHAQFGSACAFATAGVKNVAKVLSLRGSDWYWYKEKLNCQAMHGLVATLMTRLVMREYDTIVTMSHRMEAEVQRVCHDADVATIPCPVNIHAFKPINKQSARAELGFARDRDKWVLFTTVSRANPIKRLPLAIEAVNRAKESIGSIRFRVATDLPHRQMPLVVGACDLVLCTSVYEGWPNSIKEGLACNLPFVSTDVSDLAEIAYQEPSCHVCPAEPGILGDSICYSLSEPSINDLRRHVLMMDVGTASHRLVDLYERVLLKKEAE